VGRRARSQSGCDSPVAPIPARTFLAVASLCFLLPVIAEASDYVAEPIAQAVQLVNPEPSHVSGLTAQGIFTETASFDSNPLLLTGGAKALYGSTTSPELILNDSTPSLRLNSDTRIDGNAFNQTSFDSVDVHSTAGATKLGELWTYGMEGKVDYDTTRTSEQSNFDLVARPFRHLGLEADPEVSYTPTAIDKVTLAGSYLSSQYQSDIFSNFEVYSVSPTYTHNFDPLNAGVFTVQAQHYDTTTNAKNTTDTVGPSLGWIAVLTPEVTAKITAGAQEAHSTQPGSTSSPWTIQSIFSADLTFKGQQSATELVASRSQYPYGNGTEALLTGVNLSETYQLNNRLALNAGADYSNSTYPVFQTGNVETSLGANVGFTYAVNDQINVKTLYQFRYETLSNIQDPAEESVLTVSLSYKLNPQSL
jgi:hypothetical protein